jgi:regulatory protein
LTAAGERDKLPRVPPKPGPDCEQKALELVARRPHFRAELARKLADRGYPPPEVEAALERLAKLGYLSDGELAASEAERLRERKGLGRAGVARELGRRGAGAESVDAALEPEPAERELETARSAAARWSRGGRGGAAALGRHLRRKGFAGNVIFRVLNELALTDGSGEEPGSEPLEAAEPADPDPLEP